MYSSQEHKMSNMYKYPNKQSGSWTSNAPPAINPFPNKLVSHSPKKYNWKNNMVSPTSSPNAKTAKERVSSQSYPPPHTRPM